LALMREGYGFCLFVWNVGELSLLISKCLMGLKNTKIHVNDRIPSCPILKFMDFGQIMAIGQCSIEAQNCDS
jgi:hypothetical protein